MSVTQPPMDQFIFNFGCEDLLGGTFDFCSRQGHMTSTTEAKHVLASNCDWPLYRSNLTPKKILKYKISGQLVHWGLSYKHPLSNKPDFAVPLFVNWVKLLSNILNGQNTKEIFREKLRETSFETLLTKNSSEQIRQSVRLVKVWKSKVFLFSSC